MADAPYTMDAARQAFDLFMQRMRGHQQRLNDGEDPLDVDVAAVVELRKCLNVAGIRLPSNAFLFALSDVLDGGRPAYLLRDGDPHRRKLSRHRQWVGAVAHLVETLYVNRVCSAAEAARRVAAGLREAGLSVTDRAVADWHRDGVHQARHPDPARDLFELQQVVFRRMDPDHQWEADRWREWLDTSIRALARLPGLYD